MVSQIDLFSVSDPFLNLRCKEIALMIAVHDIGRILFFLGFEEVQKNIFLL